MRFLKRHLQEKRNAWVTSLQEANTLANNPIRWMIFFWPIKWTNIPRITVCSIINDIRIASKFFFNPV